MSQSFDKEFWESHWHDAPEPSTDKHVRVNPHLVRAIAGLPSATALDAGSGAGVEALWLASTGWRVTAVDISAEAQRRAQDREAQNPPVSPVDWIVADLDRWQPGSMYDLVCTHYAHPAGSQLEFYDRISRWVKPGGMLVIVGHLHSHDHHNNGHTDGPPPEATVRAGQVVELLGTTEWVIHIAEEVHRSVETGAGRSVQLHDVVVSATRQAVIHDINL